MTWTVVGLNPHLCLWIHDLQVHGSNRLGYHADLYTVGRCCTRGESEDHTGKKLCKGSTLVLKPMADVTKSPKQGYQWPQKKNLRPPIIKKKKGVDILILTKLSLSPLHVTIICKNSGLLYDIQIIWVKNWGIFFIWLFCCHPWVSTESLKALNPNVQKVFGVSDLIAQGTLGELRMSST